MRTLVPHLNDVIHKPLLVCDHVVVNFQCSLLLLKLCPIKQPEANCCLLAL